MKRGILRGVVFFVVTMICWVFIFTVTMQAVTTREVPVWVPIVSFAFAALIGWGAALQVGRSKSAAKQ